MYIQNYKFKEFTYTKIPKIRHVQIPPLCRVTKQGCMVFCNICRSTKSLKFHWSYPFLYRSCDQRECITNKVYNEKI